MPGRKNTTSSENDGGRGKLKANLVVWPFGCVSTATMSVRHGRSGMMTENMAGKGDESGPLYYIGHVDGRDVMGW